MRRRRRKPRGDGRVVRVFGRPQRVQLADEVQPDRAYAFQAEIEVRADAGFVARPDLRGAHVAEWDDQVADLHYADTPEYATGHGVSAEWDLDNGGCRTIRTAWIAELATRRLRERGEREARDLEETLRRQRERIVEELGRHEGQYAQITLDFDDDERRQLQTNMRYWRTRLDQFDRDLKQEPGRIRAFYEVQAKRVEPVGLVYLWPETN